MSVTVRLPASLRALAGGVSSLEVDGSSTVADVLDRLATEHPALERRLRDERGALRPHVNVFVGTENIRDLDGPATSLHGASEVTILPSVSGGA
jgi:sulfur-carrier protein